MNVTEKSMLVLGYWIARCEQEADFYVKEQTFQDVTAEYIGQMSTNTLSSSLHALYEYAEFVEQLGYGFEWSPQKYVEYRRDHPRPTDAMWLGKTN